MITDGAGPPIAVRLHSKQAGDVTDRRSRGSSLEIGTKKSQGSGTKSKESNGDGATDRKSRGSSQRSSLSISGGMKTYREHAGSKMAAMAIVAREKMVVHQAELAELIRYLAFLVLFVLAVFLRAPQDLPSFWNQALRARFTPVASRLDDVRISHINFNNVTTKTGFWLYMNNVFAPALESDDFSNMFMRNSLLGGIQLRQVRSESRDCAYSIMLDDPRAMCFDTSTLTVSKSKYGGPKGDMFVWTPQPQSNVNRFLLAPDANYGTGGFVTYLSTTANVTRSTLRDLCSNGFIDAYTRALFIDFTLQNPTDSWLCMVRLLFDMPPYGGVRPSSYFRVTNVKLYETTSDLIVSCIEALFIILFLRIGMVTWREMKRGFLVFFSTFWGIIDFLNMLIFGLIIIMSVIFRVCASTLYSQLESDSYVDFQSAAYTNNQIYNLSAFNAVLSWIKVLKYLRLSRRLSMLERVFTNVRFELLAWILLFLVIFSGFSQGFFMAFRDVISKYQTVFVSMTTLFQGVYGQIELRSLQNEAAILGPLLFVVYIFVICFLMMSMFLAILQGAWMKTEEDALGDGEDDLAAALQFAISNAKTQAKRQGFKLRNLMVRQPKLPKSPRHNAKPQLSPRENRPRHIPKNESIWKTLKRGQTLPRQVLSTYDPAHSPRSPKRFAEVPHSPRCSSSETPSYSVGIASSAPQLPPHSPPDTPMSSIPARAFLEAPPNSRQVGTPKTSLKAQSMAQAYIAAVQQPGSDAIELPMQAAGRNPSRKSVLLTPRQMHILNEALQSLQVSPLVSDSDSDKSVPR